MRIRTKLRLIVLLTILSGITIVATAYISTQAIESSILKKEQVATSLLKGFGELVVLSNEYAATYNTRALKQRNQQYQSLVKLSNTLVFGDSQKQYLFNQIKTRLKVIAVMFDDLYQHLSNTSDKNSPLYSKLKTALSERLTIETQAAADDAFKISSLTRQEIVMSHKKLNEQITLLAVTLTLLIASIAFLLKRSIVKPINALHREIKRIETGSPTHTIEVDSNDELGMLAQSFNQMAATLQATTISRDELEEYVKQRTLELKHTRDEAEKASAAKSEFLSRMSHELRTPMNAILGFAQLLEMDTRLSEEQKDSINEILTAGYHLLELINEVLDLAKIESGKMEIKAENIHLDQFIPDCIHLVSTQAENRQITIFHSPLNISVYADKVRLKQVILNLLTNAIKYNHNGGEVHIEVTPHDSFTRILIRNTGPGIPADKADLIFKAFERLGMEEMKVDGTGIGLTISKQLVELMHGKIDFSSNPELGTSFWIDIPSTAH